MDSNEMKNQAKYIWDRLDDLASTDPDAYKKFIEQQMKERDKYMSSPEPKFCFVTKMNAESYEKEVYVNVCGWKRISYPTNDTEPLNLMCGFKVNHNGTKNSKRHMTIPIAANDQAIDELIKSTADKVDLIKLIIEFIIQTQKINISRTFKSCKEIFKGDLPADPKRLFVNNPQSEFSEANLKDLLDKGKVPDDLLSSPENLIKNLSTKEDSGPNASIDFVETFKNAKDHKDKTLIEEVEQVEQTPEFSLNEVELEGRVNLSIQIKLPLVERTSDCDLNVSTNEVDLAVPGKYQLKVELPKQVNQEEAKARFRKKISCLIVTMPVLEQTS